MKIKRWFLISLLGVVLVGAGAIAFASIYRIVRILGLIIILCGIILVVLGIGKSIVSLLTLLLPNGERELINILQRRYLERRPKIVTVGGGHGLSNLLLGLKEYSANITAIVTVADSGGSSGRLRQEFNIVAPGDIRNCLVALADAPALMGQLFQFRFSKDSQLQGHNFGNLFLAAMVQLTGGDFEKAVEESSKVLAIRGKVVPATVTNVHLAAEYADGSITEGEAKIPDKNMQIKRVFLTPADAIPTKEALKAIAEADVIVLGPGSLYTSVIPNLVIPGVAEAMASTAAFKIYVCNVMTQRGETNAYTASDHIKALVEHTNKSIINACVVNNAQVPLDAQGRYKTEDQFPVKDDIDKIKEMGYIVAATDLLTVDDYVRHDSAKLTKALIELIEKYRVIKR